VTANGLVSPNDEGFGGSGSGSSDVKIRVCTTCYDKAQAQAQLLQVQAQPETPNPAKATEPIKDRSDPLSVMSRAAAAAAAAEANPVSPTEDTDAVRANAPQTENADLNDIFAGYNAPGRGRVTLSRIHAQDTIGFTLEVPGLVEQMRDDHFVPSDSPNVTSASTANSSTTQPGTASLSLDVKGSASPTSSLVSGFAGWSAYLFGFGSGSDYSNSTESSSSGQPSNAAVPSANAVPVSVQKDLIVESSGASRVSAAATAAAAAAAAAVSSVGLAGTVSGGLENAHDVNGVRILARFMDEYKMLADEEPIMYISNVLQTLLPLRAIPNPSSGSLVDSVLYELTQSHLRLKTYVQELVPFCTQILPNTQGANSAQPLQTESHSGMDSRTTRANSSVGQSTTGTTKGVSPQIDYIRATATYHMVAATLAAPRRALADPALPAAGLVANSSSGSSSSSQSAPNSKDETVATNALLACRPGAIILTNFQLVFLPLPDIAERSSELLSLIARITVQSQTAQEVPGNPDQKESDEQQWRSDHPTKAKVRSSATPLASMLTAVSGHLLEGAAMCVNQIRGLSVPLLSIEEIESTILDKRDTAVLEIKCKDCRTIRLIFEGLVEKKYFSRYSALVGNIKHLSQINETTRPLTSLPAFSVYNTASSASVSAVAQEIRQLKALQAETDAQVGSDSAASTTEKRNNIEPHVKRDIIFKSLGPSTLPMTNMLNFATNLVGAAIYYKWWTEDYIDGWTFFDPRLDYYRMGATRGHGTVHESHREMGQFKITSANKDYSVSPTYPSHVMIPKSIAVDEVRRAAQHRSYKRFPAVVWTRAPISVHQAASVISKVDPDALVHMHIPTSLRNIAASIASHAAQEVGFPMTLPSEKSSENNEHHQQLPDELDPPKSNPEDAQHSLNVVQAGQVELSRNKSSLEQPVLASQGSTMESGAGQTTGAVTEDAKTNAPEKHDRTHSFAGKAGVPEHVQNALMKSNEILSNFVSIAPPNTACLIRASQPLVGIRGARNDADEHLLSLCGGPQKALLIADARPHLNALVNNYVNSGGFENPEHYQKGQLKKVSFEFFDMVNIHELRKTHAALLSAVYKYLEHGSPPPDWHSLIHQTGHISKLSKILAGACYIANTLCRGISVLVHCTDGWDRTPQLTSLAQIMLDPFYRTLPGFLMLIEKEWLSFGHMFGLRLGYGASNQPDEVSPTFLYFLDAVHQIMLQHPTQFEFTEDLLIHILDNMDNGLFGTFLCNSQNQRQSLGLAETSASLWTDIHIRRHNFLNPLYVVRDPSFAPSCLHVDPATVGLWETYYLRWLGMHPHAQPSVQLRKLHVTPPLHASPIWAQLNLQNALISQALGVQSEIANLNAKHDNLHGDTEMDASHKLYESWNFMRNFMSKPGIPIRPSPFLPLLPSSFRLALAATQGGFLQDSGDGENSKVISVAAAAASAFPTMLATSSVALLRAALHEAGFSSLVVSLLLSTAAMHGFLTQGPTTLSAASTIAGGTPFVALAAHLPAHHRLASLVALALYPPCAFAVVHIVHLILAYALYPRPSHFGATGFAPALRNLRQKLRTERDQYDASPNPVHLSVLAARFELPTRPPMIALLDHVPGIAQALALAHGHAARTAIASAHHKYALYAQESSSIAAADAIADLDLPEGVTTEVRPRVASTASADPTALELESSPYPRGSIAGSSARGSVSMENAAQITSSSSGSKYSASSAITQGLAALLAMDSTLPLPSPNLLLGMIGNGGWGTCAASLIQGHIAAEAQDFASVLYDAFTEAEERALRVVRVRARRDALTRAAVSAIAGSVSTRVKDAKGAPTTSPVTAATSASDDSSDGLEEESDQNQTELEELTAELRAREDELQRLRARIEELRNQPKKVKSSTPPKVKASKPTTAELESHLDVERQLFGDDH